MGGHSDKHKVLINKNFIISTSIKIIFLRKKVLPGTFHPTSFWLKTLKISSTWNGKTCSTAATVASHLLALGTAAVFQFFYHPERTGEWRAHLSLASMPVMRWVVAADG